ncbi:hypothetical protein TNCV_2304731 [Trichonephila clavipes]|nr:hypothetical protein TNCV_2304731 [Trichonephila clavipes]
MHRFPTRRVFSGTEFELVTCQPRSNTSTTRLPWPLVEGEERWEPLITSKAFSLKIGKESYCRLYGAQRYG